MRLKCFATIIIHFLSFFLHFTKANSWISQINLDFGPNQLAANEWYKPRGVLINGHFENSYSNSGLWPSLRSKLSENRNTLIIQAAEIGFMSSNALLSFRRSNISIAIALPAFTQCYNGTLLANLELYGESPNDTNLFCSIFRICNPSDRLDPNHRGWLITQDGYSYTPDLLNFDERMPNLVPYLVYEKLMNSSTNPPEWCHPELSWIERKNQARTDNCPQIALPRIENLMNDYVAYLSIVDKKFNQTTLPRLQINWNVVAGWEWRDEICLDQLYAKYPSAVDFDHAYRFLTDPCHRDTQHLDELVQLLCSVHHCPDVIYMDIDLIYSTSYALDVLRRNKQVLNKFNVSFGINLVDQCVEQENCVVEISSLYDHRLVLNLNANVTYPDLTRNSMQELSLINSLKFLRNENIVDQYTRIAVISWTSWPIEKGIETTETNSGGMAHTANRIFEILNKTDYFY